MLLRHVPYAVPYAFKLLTLTLSVYLLPLQVRSFLRFARILLLSVILPWVILALIACVLHLLPCQNDLDGGL